jgi:hypothetical protein
MRHYRHEISAIEQKWIVLDTMHRQIADDPQSETVSSEHILGTLEESAFAPSFETVIESLCERVLVAYQKQPPASASSL